NIPILALDVPSGLNADTGQAVGNAETTICASHTITFIGNKPGLHTASGRDFAGNVIVADLGIASELFPAPTMYLNDVSIFEQHLAPRKFNSHKGSYGEVLIIGGSKGMAGAAMLAARAALHAGAGRTTIGFVENSPLYDSNYPEIMCRLASELTPRNEVVAIGPGLGQSEDATQLLLKMLNSDLSLVLDADALNLIAINPVLRSSLQTRKAQSILTPHPLEAARLLGVSSETIQSDRVRAAKQLADCFQCVAVLKGSGSIISTPQQPLFINTTGNAALATGGTGDVLAGVCGALLAQGMNSLNAARVAVWAHGKSADELVSRGLGPNGLTAGEIIPQIRSVLNHLIKNRHSNQLEC
ncbi:MAG: NAD(P)H-hydrate dehydratase, partial [Burkholderiales bacterium]|nr:NAD(P)H-hydrate dehydratase [Burkholderiales bacterium]